jgi:hypothetical protein
MPGPGRRFEKGNPGRPKGSKNRVTAAVALQVLADRKTPLAMMLDIAEYYYRQWLEVKDGADRRFSAELALKASTLAAPYCHARKVIIEEDTPVAVNVVDRREMGRVITVNGSNGHGSNGHGPNGNDSAMDLN